MRTLILFRHGKSDWNAPSMSDRGRPLAPRGIAAARRMGRFLAEAGVVPDLVVSSPALRAVRTVDLAVEAGCWDCTVRRDEGLYHGGVEGVMEVLRRLDDAHRSVLLSGHEPTWSQLTSTLSGGSAFKFPTGAMACMQLYLDTWREIGPTTGEVRWFVIPKVLPD